MSVSLRPRRVSLERTARVSLVGYTPMAVALSLSLSLVFSSSPDEASFHRSRERARRQTRNRIITLLCANAARLPRTTPEQQDSTSGIHDDVLVKLNRSAIESNDGRNPINISKLATIILSLDGVVDAIARVNNLPLTLKDFRFRFPNQLHESYILAFSCYISYSLDDTIRVDVYFIHEIHCLLIKSCNSKPPIL